MKKKILSISIILILLFITLFQTNVLATTHTLSEIVEKFNNSNLVASYGNLLNCEYVASINDTNPNVLIITITNTEGSLAVNYELEGSILKNDNLVNSSLITAYLLADVVGQVNGYKDGELLNNFNMFSSEVNNYTVENEGFELKDNTSYYSFKIDIDKKVPLIDESEFYLKPEVFENIKEIVEENTVGNQSGKVGKLVYNLCVGEDENQIYIGEKDEITESSYKSILSALEVMYGKEVVEYFESIYPDFSEGSMQFDGVTIDVDEQLDLEENPMFANTKVVIVTLDNAYITNKFYRTEYIGETVDAGNKIIIFDFSKDGSYELGFFDSVSSSDAAFIYKYILEPIFIEANAQLDEENTAYFNIVDEKIVVGDKDNSIFKLVVKESSIELLPTNTDLEKVTVTAKYEEIKAKQYKEDAQSEDEFRYLKYNLTFNVVYGNEPVNYMTLEGDNQIIDLSKNQGVTFRFNIDYQKFLNDGKVYVNGNLVDKAKYTSSEGSTIITLKDDYLKTLSLGKYTLKVAVADGDVSATFTVKNDTENKTNNPQTGDNIVIYIVLFIVSLVGITLIVIKNKKIKRGE